MMDARHLRFADISGIKRIDLPIAVEVWLYDITTSRWADCDVIKLATHFSHYIKNPHTDLLDFEALKATIGLDKGQVIEAGMALVAFGAIHDFDCSGQRMRATLNLSFLQRLRVLEVCSRFAELRTELLDQELPWHAEELRWVKTCNAA
ncbi:MAG: hypothetical protein ACR2PI_15065 [Hyphomicrobiaceae bacterium]